MTPQPSRSRSSRAQNVTARVRADAWSGGSSARSATLVGSSRVGGGFAEVGASGGEGPGEPAGVAGSVDVPAGCLFVTMVVLAARTMAARSAEQFPEDSFCPGRNLFVGKELRADLYSCLSGIDTDDAGEQAEVVDVPCPGGECLHREDVAR